MMDDTEMEAGSLSGSSSIGEAVSGRGQNVANDDDDDDGGEDLYYIPERRPSLDLGPNPMDVGEGHFVEQSLPPAFSYSSLSSEEDSQSMDDEDKSTTGVQLNRADSFSSSYSMDSDDCEKRIPKVKLKDDTASEPSETPELVGDPTGVRHPSLTVAFALKAICDTLGKLPRDDLQTFHTILWKRYPRSFNSPPKNLDMLDLVDLVDQLLNSFCLEVSLQITETLLGEIGHKKLIDHLQTLCIRNEVRHELSETLRKKYSEVCEDSAVQQAKRPFDDIFTRLWITSTCDNGPITEHEVMNIEKLDSNRETGKLFSTQDLFSVERLENSNLLLLLIIGVAGSGKSMAVRRLILDWIEERAHQHVSFLFPLPFRELKQFESSQISLLEIIHTLYPETQKLRDKDYRSPDCKMMFVFDGLDEYSEKLDFHNTKLLSDYAESDTLNAIVVNLLRDRLLYRGLFVVTSRPQVKPYVPWDTAYDEIEVRGFCDPDKDEYFKRRFQDPEQAARVIAYIDSVKTLRIMCHLPLFCSLVAHEYELIFKEQGARAKLPRSITFMCTKLLLALIHHHRRFRAPDRSKHEEIDFLMKLGKLAFHMLEQGQFKMTKSDWEKFGVDDVEAVINSGLCTQYITKPFVLCQEKVISFIHPTMQEYLAALYAFLSFSNQEKCIFEQQVKPRFKRKVIKGHKVMELYKQAVDRSLQCEDGKLDIFLRFLFGMANKMSLDLLQPFCTSSVKWSTFTEDATALIKKKIGENQHPGRNSNLLHCLEELGVSASEAVSS